MSTAEAIREKVTDRIVLLVISGGLIVILLGIITGIFTTPRALPNWAENVLVSIGTAAALKLGDCLSTLIALSTGKTTERLSSQLANTVPADVPPKVQIEQPGGEPIPVTETKP
jgi:hypothetical protein